MEGSVSSTASQPPGESPWKIAAKPNKITCNQSVTKSKEQRSRVKIIKLHSALSRSQYVQCLENLLKADSVVTSKRINITDKTGTLRESQERSHSVLEAAITHLISLTQSANEATAGIAANPASRI